MPTEMTHDKQSIPRVAVVSGAIGATIGGLLPISLSIIGVWGYTQRGYLLSRQGEAIAAGWPTWLGFLWYLIMLIGGIVLIRWGYRFYRRHNRSLAAPE